MFSLICAVDEQFGIGKDGDLLFKIPEDMKYFRNTTKNKIIVMGRKTFESLPNKKPLKDRTNVVLTNNKNLKIDGAYVFNSVNEVLMRFQDSESVFIIGGEQIYKQFLPHCEKACITKVFNNYNADTFMVNLDKLNEWKIISESNFKVYNENKYKFYIYQRVSNS